VSTIATAASTHSAVACSRASVMDRLAAARCRGGCRSGPLPIPLDARSPASRVANRKGRPGRRSSRRPGRAGPGRAGGPSARRRPGSRPGRPWGPAGPPPRSSPGHQPGRDGLLPAQGLGHPAGLEGRGGGDQPLAGQPPFRVGHAVGGQGVGRPPGQLQDGPAVRGAVQGVLDHLEEPLVLGEEQLLLVGEVAEEGPAGDVGRGRDLVDGGALESALLEGGPSRAVVLARLRMPLIYLGLAGRAGAQPPPARLRPDLCHRPSPRPGGRAAPGAGLVALARRPGDRVAAGCLRQLGQLVRAPPALPAAGPPQRAAGRRASPVLRQLPGRGADQAGVPHNLQPFTAPR
jgi:hypothetical protein